MNENVLLNNPYSESSTFQPCPDFIYVILVTSYEIKHTNLRTKT